MFRRDPPQRAAVEADLCGFVLIVRLLQWRDWSGDDDEGAGQAALKDEQGREVAEKIREKIVKRRVFAAGSGRARRM